MLDFLCKIDEIVWGVPLLVLLIGVGILLTIKLRGIQFRRLWLSHKMTFTRHDDSSPGDISHFQSLMTALAATIGIGSIAGVATAIAIGGVGSLFWMWVAALVGMATRYAEALLAVKYRIVDEFGEMSGGPMYYLERGAKMKTLAIIFSIIGAGTAIGTGNMVQANSVAQAAEKLMGLDPLWVGGVLVIMTGYALFKGIKRIGVIASYLVPLMGLFYIVSGGILLVIKFNHIPEAFRLIFTTAFTGQAATGGFVGSSIMVAIQMGISRGVFSSEAGLGSSPIAAAAAKSDVPGRQALVSMSSVFLTSCVVCTITGLVITVSGVLGTEDKCNGAVLTIKAFDSILPGSGKLVMIALIPFAYSTILGWAYYGEKCVEYLFGGKAVMPYRVLYTLALIPGALMSLELVWLMANILNGLMAFPNLIGILALTSVVVAESNSFELLLKKEKL